MSPSTVLRWHREGFRLLWKWKSKRRRATPPRVAESTIELIQRMARENRLWGAERIRGELLKLGIRGSKRTIQRVFRAPRPPGDGQSWRTFLQNHTVWACDFLQLHDLWFRPIFAFFIVDVNTKRVRSRRGHSLPHEDLGRPTAAQRHSVRPRAGVHHSRSRR